MHIMTHVDLNQADSAATIEDRLALCIKESLDLFLLDNARFLAERLVAQRPDARAKALLATCYMRCDEHYRVPRLLQGCQDQQCRYLLATCLVKLPGKLQEARAVLLPGNDRSRVPRGAAGFFLLGRIARLSNRQHEAVEWFREALLRDPLLWQAYEELCSLDVSQAEQWLQSGRQPANGTRNDAGLSTPSTLPFPGFPVAVQHATPSRQLFGERSQSSAMQATGVRNRFATVAASSAQRLAPQQKLAPPVFTAFTPISAASPSNDMSTLSFGTPGSYETPPAMAAGLQPPPLPARAAGAPNAARQGSVEPTPASHTAIPSHGLSTDGRHSLPAASSSLSAWDAPVLQSQQQERHGSKIAGEAPRKSGGSQPEFLPDSASRAQELSVQQSFPATPLLMRRHDAHGGSASGGALQAGSAAETPRAGSNAEQQVLRLLQTCGSAVRLLAAFRCQDALAALERLPHCHQNTGWWWCQVGRAKFELVDYAGAADAFAKARKVDPCRLQGMEVYSTALWHLKREVELSHLAQEALALDRLSPHTCCVLGNCFSLQKEHENALRFCQRALQVDPTYAYAYTLCGHEYFANDDLQKGIDCYRHAIRLDPRHYQAWYGIGQIYYRQEQFVEAEKHFRRASTINRRSSVLHCYLGMALHKQGRTAEALQRLQDAVKVDSRNPLARFEKAAVLESTGRLAEALQELAHLRDLLPREGSVHFKMGRVCRRLNQADHAVQAFSRALALNPSAADVSMIKAAIEKIQTGEGDDEDEMR